MDKFSEALRELEAELVNHRAAEHEAVLTADRNDVDIAHDTGWLHGFESAVETIRKL